MNTQLLLIGVVAIASAHAFSKELDLCSMEGAESVVLSDRVDSVGRIYVLSFVSSSGVSTPIWEERATIPSGETKMTGITVAGRNGDEVTVLLIEYRP